MCLPHPRRDDLWLVKRIMATPGDGVEITNGDLSVNGQPSRHLKEDLRPLEPDGSWEVGSGEMFVLSDAHHSTRADSRKYGPVPIRGSYRVIGRTG